MISYPQDLIVEELLNLIKKRSDEGMEKYRQPMTRTDLPADFWRKNAIEELIDLLLYLQRSMKTLQEAEDFVGGMALAEQVGAQRMIDFIYGDANGT